MRVEVETGWMRQRVVVATFAVVASITVLAVPYSAAVGGKSAAPLQAPSLVTPVAVFGADDRTGLPPAYRRYQDALGVLFKTRGEKAPKLEEFWFARNYDETRDYSRIAGHASRAAAQNVVAGSTALSVSPPIDATSDWALVRLQRPVCAKALFDIEPMSTDEIVAASAAGQVFQLAYHRDYTLWKQAYSKPCKVAKEFGDTDWSTVAGDFSNPDALILHQCDTGGASSGSPLLVDTPRGPKVVAINVGTYVQSKVIVRQGQTVQRMKPETIANTAVSVRAFESAMQSFRGATVLMTTASVKELQGTLARVGYYKGPLDGSYGLALRTAIAAFEVAEKMPVTGIASEAILLKAREHAGRR